jgi:propionate CoA-transferase
VTEGCVPKFVDKVEQMSFSAQHSREVGQQVVYVTERAVFRLLHQTLELVEIAPGIDLDDQVLKLMPFQPVIRSVGLMPSHVFAPPKG